MIPDLKKYHRHLDGVDLDDKQRADLLMTVWSIMENFADAAFGEHPVQQVAAHVSKFPIGPPNTIELKAAFAGPANSLNEPKESKTEGE